MEIELFFVLLNVDSPQPPTVRFKTLEHVKKVAEKLVLNNPGRRYYILMAVEEIK